MAGARLTLSTRNASGIAARFYAANSAVQRETRTLMRRAGEAEHGLVREEMLALRIFRTGAMYDRLRLDMQRDGLAYEVGWRARDFRRRGVPSFDAIGRARRRGPGRYSVESHSFYPLYVVFGTTRMPARDPLTPARMAVRPYVRRELARILSDAARGRTG